MASIASCFAVFREVLMKTYVCDGGPTSSEPSGQADYTWDRWWLGFQSAGSVLSEASVSLFPLTSTYPRHKLWIRMQGLNGNN